MTLIAINKIIFHEIHEGIKESASNGLFEYVWSAVNSQLHADDKTLRIIAQQLREQGFVAGVSDNSEYITIHWPLNK